MSTKEKIRCFSGTLLAAALTVPLLLAGRGAATAHAAERHTEPYVVEAEDRMVPEEGMLPDNDELFAGYVMRAFYGGGIAPLSDYGEAAGVLNEKERKIYGELKAAVKEIAEGKRSSTIIPVRTELGIVPWDTDKEGEELQKEISEKVKEQIDVAKIVNCLMVDCPYEMYWFDKTQGYIFPDGVIKRGQTISIENPSFRFCVAQNYAGKRETDGTCYTVDTKKISKIPGAVKNAQQIVQKHAGKSDYAKLTAYKDAICDLTDYNYDAADGSYTGGYGDPWQMIYVFDNDPNTKVVCEGYSKAFQYLCDQSGLTCYTVTGYMNGGTGAGAHMWNIVTLGGKNYLADVTNSDEGSIGWEGDLFLAGVEGDVEEGYEFPIGISYTYHNPHNPSESNEALELYGEEILTLAEMSYAEFLKPVITKQPESQTITYGENVKALQVSVQGAGSLFYQWYLEGKAIEGATRSSYQPPQVSGDGTPGLDAGEYHYQCRVTCEGETTASQEVVLKVEPRLISPVMQVAQVEKVYDGTDAVLEEQGFEMGGDVRKYTGDEIQIFYSIQYNSPAVKEADTIVTEFTLEGKDAGNYRVEQPVQKIPGRITPKPLTASVSVKNKEYDGTAAAEMEETILYGVMVGDDVELMTGTAVFATAAVGSNIPVSFTGFTISGKDASNYILEKQPEPVTASITEAKKPEDQNQNTNSGNGNGSTNPPADDKKEPSGPQPEPPTEKAPGKAALASVKASGGKKLTVKWKKMAGASGYEVQCCLKKNFKSGVKKAMAKKGNKTSLVIKKLKKGKSYYVRIRAYKTVKVNGKTQKLYGAWSKAKKSKKIK